MHSALMKQEPDPRERTLRLIGEDFRVHPGLPLPLGASRKGHELNFSVFSRHATSISLVLFDLEGDEPLIELPLDAAFHRTGDLWHIGVDGLPGDFRYGWRAGRDGDAQSALHRFDAGVVLLDPYATAIDGLQRWGKGGSGLTSVFVNSSFDWEFDRPPGIPLAEKIIYELHVRGFTAADPEVANPGTFQALAEKIPYLLSLGVTTVELLPVYEFDEGAGGNRVDPATGKPLVNFWGYSPLSFFAVKSGYAVCSHPWDAPDEFRSMVRAFHKAGLEVFLDVVFNHTGEGDGRHGDASSLRGLDNSIYYIIDPASGFDRDYSGCGNTLNCNHPLVRELILDALHYWVAEMHVDGFRFDLASILGRGRNGEVLANPPLIERITEDPLLRDTTIIAEAWDAAGLYQVGKFPARWAEWNGPFRDDVRDFLRGAGSPDHLATRLAGSADLFHDPDRSPSHSINFVTSHDGFTLRDLVSYDQKHNRRNGEEDRDGCNDNRSWNCGAEGQSSDRAVLARRDRQVRNAFTILFLSQGTPMFLAGDELGRTQGGNNNAYCQDNETSWVDWSLETGNADLLDFVRRLIVFRKETPVLNRTTFFTGQPSPLTGLPDVIWHGAALGRPEFGSAARVLAMHLPGGPTDTRGQDVYFAVNAWTEPISFELPAPPSGSVWRLMFDTAAPDQRDNIVAGRALLQPHSCVVLRSEGRP